MFEREKAFETAILRYEPGEFMMHRPDDDREPESVVTVPYARAHRV